MERRAPYYRILLGLAALYNLAFALWAGLAPNSFFDLFGLDRPNYPAIWRCLGMVVGTYGLAYAWAALHLDRGAPFVAVGLLGKILGPIGWVATVHSGEWPLRTFTLILFNDLVWWLPFGLYLIDSTGAGARLRAAAARVCAGLNAVAALALLVWLRPGSALLAGGTDSAAYIASHRIAWTAGWGIWIAAALSLLAFYAWWGARLGATRWAVGAFLIATAGFACDVLAESLYIGWIPDGVQALEPAANFMTGAVANGLYTVAGALLTLMTPGLRPGLRGLSWATWTAGGALTATTLAGSGTGVVVSAGILMTLFCPWAWLMRGALR